MKYLCLVLTGAVLIATGLRAEPEIKGSPAELAQYLSGVPRLVAIAGESEVKVPADRAILTLKVASDSKSLKDALAANQQLLGALTAYLKERGIASDQVQPAKFASTPRHWVFTDKIKSYHIENEVRIKARDDKEFQTVASALDKWSDVTYAGIDFEHTDKEGLRQKAVAQACDNATARRKNYEDKLGLKLTPKGFGTDGGEAAMVERLRTGPAFGGSVGAQGGTAPSTVARPSYAGKDAAEFSETLNAFGEMVFKARVIVNYAVETR